MRRRIELFRVAVDHAKGRVKLLAGVAALTTKVTVDLTQAAKDLEWIVPSPAAALYSAERD